MVKTLILLSLAILLIAGENNTTLEIETPTASLFMDIEEPETELSITERFKIWKRKVIDKYEHRKRD